ncbi:protein kinase domain-containing protein [Haliangium sp.]|uniref:serine/threonine-protein kinase n=1 Tax=Haliangium sp. TaxID=2663208 RepID=UPI003D09EFA7
MASPRDRARELLHRRTVEMAETLPGVADETIVPTQRLSDAAAQEALVVLTDLIARGGHELDPRFSVGEVVGKGGMGTVRLARQRALDRDVVVKSLRESKRSPQATAELLREAWVTGALEHPNVVPVYDIGLDGEGNPGIVFKRIEGVTWSALIRDPEQVAARFGTHDLLEWNLRVLMQVSNAARFAHSRGIVHRDLKPDNVMIGEFGEVYVVDWGIAVSLRDDGTGRLPLAADATDMAGTPCYMAPEMLGGAAPEISERTDIYLLGAILYEILTGRPPHGGDSPLQVFTSVLESEPALPPGAPEVLVRICRRAMAPQPEQRFSGAVELHRALQDFLQHRGSDALVHQAEAHFVKMHDLLAEAPADSREIHEDRRQELYKLYGACRFGFLEALSAWPDNPAALAGLRSATQTMIEYELGHDDPRAAAALMADVARVVEYPPSQRARVEHALRAKAREEDRAAELKTLGHELDIRIGARTRAVVVLFMGLSWVVVPFIVGLVRDISTVYPGNVRMAVWSSGVVLFYAVVVYAARRTLLQSAINRRLVVMMGFMLIGQSILHLGAGLGGVTPAVAQGVQFFYWCGVITAVTGLVEVRLFPTALAYLGGFFAAMAAPDLRFFTMAGANLVLLVNALIIWMPRAPHERRQATSPPR